MITPNDVHVMASTIYGEARGSTQRDREAVGWTIRTRAEIAAAGRLRALYGDGSLRGACLAAWQYSCWNSSDPNRARLLALELPGALGDPSYRDCLLAALTVIAASAPEPLLAGVTHYHTKALTPPNWTCRQPDGRQAVCVGQIGAHLYYRDVP